MYTKMNEPQTLSSFCLKVHLNCLQGAGEIITICTEILFTFYKRLRSSKALVLKLTACKIDPQYCRSLSFVIPAFLDHNSE